MTFVEAIILGIIQGATEFLPVSSSGHTVLLPRILNLGEPSLSLIAIAHQGTLLAVLIYFWRDLWAIVCGVLDGLRQGKPLGNPDARLGWYIVVGTIPAVIAGLTLEDFVDSVFGQPLYAAFFLLVTAGILVGGERLRSGKVALTEIGWWDALIVGLFQMLALLPGISRSGSTITAGLWRGLDRETAARFSFLLGVPAILGAGLLSLLDVIQEGNLAAQAPVFLGAFVAAGLTGYGAIAFLLAWLRDHSLYPFAVYCALFGGLYLLFALI